MKLPDAEEFNFKDCEIAGDPCWLITPKDMATKWTDEKARFRSCIVRKHDYVCISQGFGKFTNFGERPDFQPWDNSWKIEARHKLDGSLLIVSRYKGELIVRTRGTVDARQMANGHEIDLLIAKYPRAFDNDALDLGTTFLYEWTTPSNIIVLREHDEPTLTLVGAVDTLSGVYCRQSHLDGFAEWMNVNRPQKYEYDSVEECILDVAAWSGKEGVVLYSPDGQTLKKIKADEYCELHKLATGIKGVKQVLEVFMASPRFDTYPGFYKYIETTLDYEVAEKCSVFIDDIVREYNKFLIEKKMIQFELDTYVKPLPTRKEQALHIQQRFSDWQLRIAFTMLDGKEVPDKFIFDVLYNKLNPNE